jgi:divalent metal cation (Fe/Co/Zn/Cd) transporter
MLGLVAALTGILCADRLGIAWADGAASLAIGFILAIAAIFLAIETKSLLIGEAAGSQLVNGVISLAMREDFVKSVNEARTLHFGPEDVLLNLSVDVRDNTTGAAIESGVSRLESRIKASYPEIKRIFIEVQGARASAARLAEGDKGGGPVSQ